MSIKGNRRGTASVTCPSEYKGLRGCGTPLTYSHTTDNGLIECPRCRLWFAPADVVRSDEPTATDLLPVGTEAF